MCSCESGCWIMWRDLAGAEGSAFHLQPHFAAVVLAQLQNAPVVHPQPSQVAPRPPKVDIEFTLDDIKKYFNIPAKQAAKKLNIGITKLKLVCRHLGASAFFWHHFHTNLFDIGVRRWPYRTLRAAVKKPASKLAARVRKEGIVQMVRVFTAIALGRFLLCAIHVRSKGQLPSDRLIALRRARAMVSRPATTRVPHFLRRTCACPCRSCLRLMASRWPARMRYRLWACSIVL